MYFIDNQFVTIPSIVRRDQKRLVQGTPGARLRAPFDTRRDVTAKQAYARSMDTFRYTATRLLRASSWRRLAHGTLATFSARAAPPALRSASPPACPRRSQRCSQRRSRRGSVTRQPARSARANSPCSRRVPKRRAARRQSALACWSASRGQVQAQARRQADCSGQKRGCRTLAAPEELWHCRFSEEREWRVGDLAA